MVQWLAASPHSAKVLGSILGQGTSSHNPTTCKLVVRLIGHSKLSVGGNVSVNGCLSQYVSPAMNWKVVHGDPDFT